MPLFIIVKFANNSVIVSMKVILIFFVVRRTILTIGQGPVVQSIVSLASSLVVKMFNVLVCTISNSQVFLQKKM